MTEHRKRRSRCWSLLELNDEERIEDDGGAVHARGLGTPAFDGLEPGGQDRLRTADVTHLLERTVHVDDGLEGAVGSLNRLFSGNHDGKLLVRVSEEP